MRADKQTDPKWVKETFYTKGIHDAIIVNTRPIIGKDFYSSKQISVSK